MMGPWGLPMPPPPKGLRPVDDAEAVQTLLEMVNGRFYSESWQGRYEKLKKAGYVLAKEG